MVKVICRTNLDINRSAEKWPNQLPARPVIGDHITSSHTHVGNANLTLEVVGIRWFQTNGDWVCETELHLPKYRFENISDFEKWYKSIQRV